MTNDEKAAQVKRLEDEHARIRREIRSIPFEYDQYGELKIARWAKKRHAELVRERHDLEASLNVAYRS